MAWHGGFLRALGRSLLAAITVGAAGACAPSLATTSLGSQHIRIEDPDGTYYALTFKAAADGISRQRERYERLSCDDESGSFAACDAYDVSTPAGQTFDFPTYASALHDSALRIATAEQALVHLAPAGGMPLDETLHLIQCFTGNGDETCPSDATLPDLSNHYDGWGPFTLLDLNCRNLDAMEAAGISSSLTYLLRNIIGTAKSAFGQHWKTEGLDFDQVLSCDHNQAERLAMSEGRYPFDGRGDVWFWEQMNDSYRAGLANYLTLARTEAKRERLSYEVAAHVEAAEFPELITRESTFGCATWANALEHDLLGGGRRPALSTELRAVPEGDVAERERLARVGIDRMLTATACARDRIEEQGRATAAADRLRAAAELTLFPAVVREAAVSYGAFLDEADFVRVFGAGRDDPDQWGAPGSALGRAIAELERQEAGRRWVRIGILTVAAIGALTGVGAFAAGALGLSLGAMGLSTSALVSGLSQVSWLAFGVSVAGQGYEIVQNARKLAYAEAGTVLGDSPDQVVAYLFQKQRFARDVKLTVASTVAAVGLAAGFRLIARFRAGLVAASADEVSTVMLGDELAALADDGDIVAEGIALQGGYGGTQPLVLNGRTPWLSRSEIYARIADTDLGKRLLGFFASRGKAPQLGFTETTISDFSQSNQVHVVRGDTGRQAYALVRATPDELGQIRFTGQQLQGLADAERAAAGTFFEADELAVLDRLVRGNVHQTAPPAEWAKRIGQWEEIKVAIRRLFTEIAMREELGVTGPTVTTRSSAPTIKFEELVDDLMASGRRPGSAGEAFEMLRDAEQFAHNVRPQRTRYTFDDWEIFWDANRVNLILPNPATGLHPHLSPLWGLPELIEVAVQGPAAAETYPAFVIVNRLAFVPRDTFVCGPAPYRVRDRSGNCVHP